MGKVIIVFITSLLANVAFAGEPIWDANKLVLKSEKLADGVFAHYSDLAPEQEINGIPAGTSGGFIIGEHGVLMIETMLNQYLYLQVEEMIKKQSKLPILYAVNTSYHGDHSYGNMFLPKETQIIQHKTAKEYVDNHFKADIAFMLQNFGAGRGIEEVKPVTGDILISDGSRITLDLGGKFVEIIDFGFAQTGGDLFIWEPESKVMWTGNPIITIQPALPWLLDGHLTETLATIQKVYDFLPKDARIVPGHGSVMTRDDLKWHLEYLQAVRSQVQQAIDEGLSLQQTVDRVVLPEFKGYQLYPWVHPSLNVPAAYKDLSNN